MWVWVLKNSSGEMIRMQYKRGTYGHAFIFYTEADANQAVEYFGGTYKCSKVWLDI